MGPARILLKSTIAISSALALFAQELPLALRPESVGFSSERLKHIDQRLQEEVDQHRIPGAVILIARQGKIAYFRPFGFQDRAKHLPLATNSIFRIASMTKPITSVAAMMLAEEGKIDIWAPVSQYLPDFKDVKVGLEKADPVRPMTVQDLLRHTSGLTYGFFGNSDVDQLYRKAGLFDPNQTLAEMVTKLSKLPLEHQPGTVWEYSFSTDVLARIVEVTSGMELDQFFAERITKPLRMSDTAFYLNEAQVRRLTIPDNPNVPAMVANPLDRPKFFSGGGGLFSTVMDYARFSQMLLNGGELDGVRLLSPKNIALMTADSLPPGTNRHTPVAMMLGPLGPTPDMGVGFGLGFAVRAEPGRNPLPGSVGEYYWVGATGTSFWVDPQEKLISVFMVQLPLEKTLPYFCLTRELVYQALTTSFVHPN